MLNQVILVGELIKASKEKDITIGTLKINDQHVEIHTKDQMACQLSNLTLGTTLGIKGRIENKNIVVEKMTFLATKEKTNE